MNSFWVVLLTPAAINFRFFGYFWLVSMTPGKNVIAGFNDTSDKLLWREKTAIYPVASHTLIRGPWGLWGTKTYFKPKRRYLGLVSRAFRVPFGFGSLRDLWSGCVYGCAFSWRFQWNYRRPSPTSAAGDIAVLVWTSFGGLRGPWSGCVRCLWMCLFKTTPMEYSGARGTH